MDSSVITLNQVESVTRTYPTYFKHGNWLKLELFGHSIGTTGSGVDKFTGKKTHPDIQDVEWRMTAKPIVTSDIVYAMLSDKVQVKSFVV